MVGYGAPVSATHLHSRGLIRRTGDWTSPAYPDINVGHSGDPTRPSPFPPDATPPGLPPTGLGARPGGSTSPEPSCTHDRTVRTPSKSRVLDLGRVFFDPTRRVSRSLSASPAESKLVPRRTAGGVSRPFHRCHPDSLAPARCPAATSRALSAPARSAPPVHGRGVGPHPYPEQQRWPT